VKARAKQELRNEVRRVLINLDPRWIMAASVEVASGVRTILSELPAAEALLAWVPSFPGEVDLSVLLGEQLRLREVYLPRVLAGGALEFRSIDEDWPARLQPGGMQVPEPPADYGEIFRPTPGSSTVVLVPGLAFDAAGHRLGRGKGYYDRFLAGLANFDVIKVGIGWELQVMAEVPADERDIAMDFICHERGIVRCHERGGAYR
jgi:5-formyltetrahydrofolate cyclo-ligase